MADTSSTLRWRKIIGLIPLIGLPIAMLYQVIFAESSLVFASPYVPLILQAIFVLGTSLVVAYVSARGYLNSGSLNLVFLAGALLVNGVITTISLVPLGFPSNAIVTMANLGILTSAILQFIGAIITLFPQFSTENANRKAIIITALTGSFLLIGLAIALTFSGVLPVFLESTGPTPIRLVILRTTIALLFMSCLLFTFRYFKVKSNILYWYSLALALFTLAILASVFTVKLGDIMNWVSRLAIYLTGIYFLIALLSPEPRKAELAVSQRWAETFGASSEQSAALFAKALNGFAYAKVVTNDLGKPVDWIYLNVNAAFEKIAGVKQENVIGKRVTSVFPKESTDPSNWIGKFGAVALTGEGISEEAFSQSFGKWIEVSAYSPKKGYFVSIFEDITERKKAEEAAKRQSAIIDLSPDGIFIRSLDGLISYWSLGAERLYGYSKQEAIGKISHDLLKTEFPAPLTEINSQIKRTGEWSGELRHKTKSGLEVIVQSRWLTENLKTENNNILESNIDITERKKAEEKLEEYSKNLEKIVDERTKQLRDAERLAAIGATAGMVGHDIRNPLQAITSDVYLAKTELDSIPESEEKQAIQENLTEIEKNIDYINKIVQDLQDYARPLNPNAGEADLKLIIEKLLQKNGIPESVKVSVKVEGEAGRFVADSDYLNRILYNLINNAVQAMPKGGKLTISAYKEANDIVINVKDTGVGIPEAVKNKMFTPMFTTKSKGQGFGLPVVKRMTESMGGTVSFESQESKGTTFTIRLPNKSK